VPVTYLVSRNAGAEDNQWKNPKALKVITSVEPGVSATEWAISGELVNDSSEKSRGNSAVSGVAKKLGLASVFAGHFQAIDYTGFASSEAGPLVGAEINLKANGEDDARVRVGLDMPAKTQEFDSEKLTRGHYSAAIRIRNPPGRGPTGGIWDKGLYIYDSKGALKGEPMPVGIVVRTRGDYGLKVGGQHEVAAISVARGQYIALDAQGLVRFRYEANRIQFYFKDRKIGYLDIEGGNAKLN